MKIAQIGTAHEGLGGGTSINFAFKEVFPKIASNFSYHPVIDGEILNLKKIEHADLIFLPTLGYISDRKFYMQQKQPKYIKQLQEIEKPFAACLLAPWELEIYPFFMNTLESKVKVYFVYNTILKKYYSSRGLDNLEVIPINFVPVFSIHKTNKQEKLVVCTSRLTPSKRIDMVVDAAKIATDFTFRFYGSANHISQLDYIYSRLGEGHYFGEYRSLEVPYSNAVFHIDMSTYENDGDRPQLTTLEAMSFGCVPIVRRQWVGKSFYSLVEDENVLVADSPEEIAEQLKNTTKEDINRIVNNNYKYLETRNQPEKIVKRMLEKF